MKRNVFFISDGTGITAETLGQSLLTQFDQVEFEPYTIPFVNDVNKAKEVVKKLEASYEKQGQKPLVFATFVNPEVREIIENSSVLVLDFFKAFIAPLEQEIGHKSTHTVGKTHGLTNYNNYMLRINAVNFALANDDGANTHEYDRADIILVGVSRCGKTPTCLYMALQFGLYAGNYPFTEDDMLSMELPKLLKTHRNKLFGLSIDPVRLAQIRKERRPNSKYASLKQCQHEVREVESLYKRGRIPFLNTTNRSVEEIATEILTQVGLKRKV